MYLPDISKTGTAIYMNKASGSSVIGIMLCVQRDLTRKKCESVACGRKRKSLKEYERCRETSAALRQICDG
jgi:hypothetical protein